ncbi:MAG: glycerol kinase GlpK [Acidobacteriia bacterium]|nr:glycerol kinase GlpK [Terriglobia bacterium]
MGCYLGALDHGTTSTRFIVFDRSGEVVAASQREHKQILPRPGWVEHNPQEIWFCTREVISDALLQKGLRASDLHAVGIANQRETTVLWNRRTGMPVTNAIVWQDLRVAPEVANFSECCGVDRFRAQTGLPLSTYFSALKIRWILQNVKGVRRLAETGEVLFGTMDSFLAWHLTGGPNGGIHITDVTNASRTQLMNLQTLTWDRDLLAAFDIPEPLLARICPSIGILGEIRHKNLQGIPLAGILGDQQAALVGQACFQPGDAKNTYGTGCFLLMNTGERIVQSQHGLLTTVAYQLNGEPAQYALEGSIAITGALVQWLRDNLGIIQTSEEVETLARSVDDNGGVYFVPAFSGLYAPYWNNGARGTIIGLTRYSTKAHLARAVLEATAFQTCEVIEAMQKDSGDVLQALRVDGGMTVNHLLMQFQADILKRTVVSPASPESTALGAAYAAGLGTGFYSNIADVKSNWSARYTWTSKMDAATRNRLFSTWKKAVIRSLDWAGDE